MPDASPSRVPARVLLYPLVGVLVVGNVVFALLWLLGPLWDDGRAGPGVRRIEARAGERALTVTEAADGPAVGVGARVGAREFDALAQRLAQLARRDPGRELAREFFESEPGQAAEPAVTLAFPSGKETARVEAYAVDARRQLVYCRVGPDRTPVAIEADVWQAVAAELARLGHGAVGSLALPFHVSIGDGLEQRLAGLESTLEVTTVAANPRDLLLDLANQPELATRLQIERPDAQTIAASVALPPHAALARALANAMARASDKVKARHLDIADHAEAVRELARAVQRPMADLSDALVLQVGERARVIPAVTLAPAGRFEGDAVVARALAGLLAERGLLCFATGHDERRIDDTLRAGLSRPVAQLKASGFRVQALDLTAVEAVPADCQVLVIAGPRTPYEPAVEARVARYLDGGGRIALLLDLPKGPAVLGALLARYGIAVAEPKKEFAVVQLSLDRSLDFVKGWSDEPMVLLTAGALSVKPPEGATWLAHVVAREFSAEAEAKAACLIAAVRPKPGDDGPKLLVAGDVDAFSNQSLVGLPGRFFDKEGQLVQLPGNIELFVQALAWLAE